jgi:hypothetical protein
VVVRQIARKIAETPTCAMPPALNGTSGSSQITNCGESTLEPSMNASISAAA